MDLILRTSYQSLVFLLETKKLSSETFFEKISPFRDIIWKKVRYSNTYKIRHETLKSIY